MSYCHQLSFYLICGVHLTNSAPYLPHSNKNAKKIFFVALGVHLHPFTPLATPMQIERASTVRLTQCISSLLNTMLQLTVCHPILQRFLDVVHAGDSPSD